ncbi:matrixin family metalloprotease [Kordia sp.]|uniref:matrixin family metalloprotease n=1 Tax=Kordia sp. TaxID=1965332 RepID=UPI003B59D87E
MKTKSVVLALAVALFFSCQKDADAELNETSIDAKNKFALKFDVPNDGSVAKAVQSKLNSLSKKGNKGEIRVKSNQLAAINSKLRKQNIAIASIQGMNYGIPSVELIDEQFVLTLDRHWVQNDPRNGGDNVVTYNSFTFANFANGSIPTDAISDDAFARWQGLDCGNINIARVPNNGVFNSTILFLNGENGIPVSDINTVGWLPGFVFDTLDGFSSTRTLAVAINFIWLDGDGNPTDIDGDGKLDSAYTEIWYNNNFNWAVNPTNNNAIDLASVITHEQGHSLGLGHFGALYEFSDGNGNSDFEYFPKAVMNAIYIEPNSNIDFTDEAGYCSNYLDWF